MIASNVARRYAKAIFEIGVEQGSLAQLVEQVATLADAYGTSPELRRAVEDPLVAHPVKKAILTELCDRAGVSPVIKSTLLLLGDRRRLPALPGIAQLLRELADAKQGVVRAEVTTAVRLSDGYYAKLQGQLEKMTGRRVAIDRTEDPALLAGVVVRIGDRVYDGSLKTRLAELGNALLPN